MVLAQQDIYMQKNVFNFYFTSYKKINTKLMINVNLRVKMIKNLEENLGINLQELGLDNGCVDSTPKP